MGGAHGFFEKARHLHGSGLVHSDDPRLRPSQNEFCPLMHIFRKKKGLLGASNPL